MLDMLACHLKLALRGNCGWQCDRWDFLELIIEFDGVHANEIYCMLFKNYSIVLKLLC